MEVLVLEVLEVLEELVLEVLKVLEVLVLEVLKVLEVLVLEVLKVLEIFVLEVLTYSTPSKDCVHCEIPPILCGDLTFVLELCDWAVTSTLLLLVLFTFWKVSLKIQKISIVIQIGGALEILLPLIILNT